jgi:trehalose synthase
VFPSLFEGFGIALTEAMWKALPCIASTAGPLTELIAHERTGLLTSPDAVEELAAAMTRLYRNPAERAALGSAAREEATRRFSSRALMPQWEAAYRELARKPVAAAQARSAHSDATG